MVGLSGEPADLTVSAIRRCASPAEVNMASSAMMRFSFGLIACVVTSATPLICRAQATAPSVGPELTAPQAGTAEPTDE
jgi:hypothetical protein